MKNSTQKLKNIVAKIQVAISDINSHHSELVECLRDLTSNLPSEKSDEKSNEKVSEIFTTEIIHDNCLSSHKRNPPLKVKLNKALKQSKGKTTPTVKKARIKYAEFMVNRHTKHYNSLIATEIPTENSYALSAREVALQYDKDLISKYEHIIETGGLKCNIKVDKPEPIIEIVTEEKVGEIIEENNNADYHNSDDSDTNTNIVVNTTTEVAGIPDGYCMANSGVGTYTQYIDANWSNDLMIKEGILVKTSQL